MTTLAIETSTEKGSLAVLADGVLVLEEHFCAGRGQGGGMFGALERACAVMGRCDQIAIGLGPGSYSGVRVAIAAAIGLRYGLGAELVGLPSAAGLDVPEYHSIGDARRDAFYFTHVRTGECVEGPLLLTAEELAAKLGALPVFTAAPLPQFPSAQVAVPSAQVLARLAAAGRGIVARADLEPIYLRDPHITLPKRDTPGLR